MKKFLALLLIVLLPALALADAPPTFPYELFKLDGSAFAAQCETALADTTLAGSTVAVHEDGSYALTWEEYEAFAVMRRPDGLLMMCCFVPAGEGLMLDWHNDLLLSHYQDVTLSMEGAVWSGGYIPAISLRGWTLEVWLPQPDGTQLMLESELFRDGWTVTGIGLYTTGDGQSWQTALYLPEDCLADDIYLETCEPNNWRRGSEDAWYGW